ncbi:MAG: B12-binding domain-containing radical SAM protein [Candidatus Scalindua sp.]|nr:MAG: B12-binding domain-containing radical SAM protein [Candidatus Scalindua sp.]
MVAEHCALSGHQVRTLDLMFARDPLGTLRSVLDRIQPEVVGISFRNIDNNDMQQPVSFYRELIPLVETVRRKSSAMIVLGGAAVSVMPEALLRFTGVDYAVLGDGEIVFPQLLAALSKKDIPNDIPGVAWLDETGFRSNTGFSERFMGDSLLPDFHRWVHMPSYLSRFSPVPVQTKLGCHFQCVYCTYRKIEGSEYRLCDPDTLVREIVDLGKRGVRDIEFVDNVFNSPYDHAMALCDTIAKFQTSIRFQTVELNPLFVDDKLIEIMEKAGFVGIGITVESAADPVLERLKKAYSAKEVYRTAEVVKQHKVPCLWIFLFGGPGETEETVQETLNFAEKCIGERDVALFMIGLRIYPGTELEEIARAEGLLSVSPLEMLEPIFYLSPNVHIEWLREKIQMSIATHMNFLNPRAMGLPFLPVMNYLGYWLGVKPPLWKRTRYIRRGLRWLGMDL